MSMKLEKMEVSSLRSKSCWGVSSDAMIGVKKCYSSISFSIQSMTSGDDMRTEYINSRPSTYDFSVSWNSLMTFRRFASLCSSIARIWDRRRALRETSIDEGRRPGDRVACLMTAGVAGVTTDPGAAGSSGSESKEAVLTTD